MWFGQSLIWLWLTPFALGVAYYIIPAILGKPIDKYYLAIFGFWCIATLAPWSVVHHLEGGPVPMWIPAIGTVMSIAMIFPINNSFFLNVNLHFFISLSGVRYEQKNK